MGATRHDGKKLGDNLEKKIDILDRMKYMAAPAVVMAGSYFAPEIKSKLKAQFENLSESKKRDYKMMMLGGSVLIGAIFTISSGYGLYSAYTEKKDAERHSDRYHERTEEPDVAT